MTPEVGDAANHSPDRRRFLGGIGVGSAVAAGAWVAPSVVRVDAAAAATLSAPFLAAWAQNSVSGNDDVVTVSLTSSPQPGDRLVAIIATNRDTSAVTAQAAFPFTTVDTATRTTPVGRAPRPSGRRSSCAPPGPPNGNLTGYLSPHSVTWTMAFAPG